MVKVNKVKIQFLDFQNFYSVGLRLHRQSNSTRPALLTLSGARSDARTTPRN